MHKNSKLRSVNLPKLSNTKWKKENCYGLADFTSNESLKDLKINPIDLGASTESIDDLSVRPIDLGASAIKHL